VEKNPAAVREVGFAQQPPPAAAMKGLGSVKARVRWRGLVRRWRNAS
jgi:hypothetical protein